jgi:hypothetical protein
MILFFLCPVPRYRLSDLAMVERAAGDPASCCLCFAILRRPLVARTTQLMAVAIAG